VVKNAERYGKPNEETGRTKARGTDHVGPNEEKHRRGSASRAHNDAGNKEHRKRETENLYCAILIALSRTDA